MQACYTSRVGNTSGFVGEVVEKNPFGNYLRGTARHCIKMEGIHSRWGVPQLIVFQQVSPGMWIGNHRCGDEVQLILKSKVNCSVPERQLAFLGSADIIAARDYVEPEGEWVVEEHA